MEKELEQEAEEYNLNGNWEMFSDNPRKESFIAGTNSKYVKKKIIEAQIEENVSILAMLKLHESLRSIIPIAHRIKELRRKLKEL